MAIVLKTRKRPIGTLTRFGRVAEATLLRPQWAAKTPPCTFACPNGNEMRACLTTIAQSESSGLTYPETMAKAWYILTNTNPFPSVCGQVCPHRCETECNRAEKDGAVNIAAVERAIGDYGIEHHLPHKKIREEPYPEKVAVIGSGPAGLSGAYQLARRGYAVTVFEALPVLGGMLAVGIPEYRLPRDKLQQELSITEKMGIQVKLNTPIGGNTKISDLRRDFDAIFIATGAQLSRRLSIEGSALAGVLWGVDFLKKVNLGQKVGMKDRVVVVGGGNVAVDVALTTLRLGAKEVQLACLESREEMPAFAWEIQQALDEGIILNVSWGPKKVLGDGGKVKGIELVRCSSVFDEEGRFNPCFEESMTTLIETEMVVLAIGQAPDTSFLEDSGIQITGESLIYADDTTLATSVPGIFAGGDGVTGPKSVIEAVAAGKKAAEAIDAYLRGTELEKANPPPVIRAAEMKLEFYKTLPRNEVTSLTVSQRVSNFNAITLPLAESQVIDEAHRCMSCGMCFGCDVCFSYCQDNAVKRAAEGAELKYFFELSFCTGCKKCAEECPCGFIDMD